MTPIFWPLEQEVSGWINKKATVPVWSKMTPNITDITLPARTALEAGSEGIAAINTITSVMGINLTTLRPEPSVEGHSTPGGYSCKAVKPIALAKVHQVLGFRVCAFRVYGLQGLPSAVLAIQQSCVWFSCSCGPRGECPLLGERPQKRACHCEAPVSFLFWLQGWQAWRPRPTRDSAV